MPVAVTCGIIAERYDGDTALASRAIFTSTLLSLLTLPLVLWAFAQLAW
jgi:predicted permease